MVAFAHGCRPRAGSPSCRHGSCRGDGRENGSLVGGDRKWSGLLGERLRRPWSLVQTGTRWDNTRLLADRAPGQLAGVPGGDPELLAAAARKENGHRRTPWV